MRKGKKFEEITKKSLEKYGFVYRFRDVSVNPKGAYRVPVPADFMLLRNGKAYFFECKQTEKTSFPLYHIRDVQLKYAEKIIQNGGKYYFIIYMQKYDTVYLIEAEKIIEFIEKGERSSIPVEYFNKHGIPLKLVRNRFKIDAIFTNFVL